MNNVVRLDQWADKTDTSRGSMFDNANLIENESTQVRIVRKEVIRENIEVKSVGGGASFYDYLRGNNMNNLAAYQALGYYANVSVVYDAIDDIITPAKVIQPALYNPNNQEWITDHELLDLLNNPGGGMSGELFREFWLLNKLAVGTSFMIATGQRDRPPLELLIGYPQDMTLESDSRGFLKRIFQSATSDANSYVRDDTVADNTFRYFSQDDQREMHISRYSNIRFSGTNQWGLSPLKALMPEIEQFAGQNMHNDSSLKRGATPSLLFSAEGGLTDTQYTRLNDAILNYYQGAMNAGQPIVGENGMKVSPISQTNKDMDFDNMIKSLSARIYNIYNIPLPSVMASTMTLANLEASRLLKYDDAILPATNGMFSDFTSLLVPRYKDLEGYHLTYDPARIEALEPRRLANATVVKNLNVLSTNEIRTTYLTREPISEGGGGDEVLVPGNMLPIGRDMNVNDEAINGPRAGSRPTEVVPELEDEGDGDTLLDEVDELDDDATDAAKFIAIVKRTMKLDNEGALKEAIKHGMIISLDDFVTETTRLYNINPAAALIKAIDFNIIKED